MNLYLSSEIILRTVFDGDKRASIDTILMSVHQHRALLQEIFGATRQSEQLVRWENMPPRCDLIYGIDV